MVVNIQKFKEDKTKVMVDDSYSTNLQRIFFVDEAHRGYNPQGSFLANLLEADQSAVKIALTGTPLLKKNVNRGACLATISTLTITTSPLLMATPAS